MDETSVRFWVVALNALLVQWLRILALYTKDASSSLTWSSFKCLFSITVEYICFVIRRWKFNSSRRLDRKFTGVWCNGNIFVSKTNDVSSILATPAIWVLGVIGLTQRPPKSPDESSNLSGPAKHGGIVQRLSTPALNPGVKVRILLPLPENLIRVPF